MKDIWVLSVRTSLPDYVEKYSALYFDSMIPDLFVFEQFADAKDKMRAILRDLSQENTMFDENGEIKNFRQFIEDTYSSEDDSDDEEYDGERLLTARILNDFLRALKEVFAGNDVAFSLEEGKYSDFTTISIFADDGEVSLYGDYDGPLNETDPYISTNAFSMKEEKDYHLHIKDQFCSPEYAENSLLCVDLKKVRME